MPAADRLYDLLLALFRSDAELQRFFVLEGYPVERLIPAVKGSSSLRYAASSAARALVEQGLADDRLFDALRRRSPERVDDVDRVAAEIREEEGAVPADPGRAVSPAVPRGVESPANDTDEEAEFRMLLRAELASVEVPDPAGQALAADRWPWTAAASVLGSFRPTLLHPLAGSAPPEPALVALVSSVHTLSDGSWVLDDTVRLPCLRRLGTGPEMAAALAANAVLPDPRRDLLQTLLGGEHPPLYELDADQLADIDAVSSWLEPAGLPLPVSRLDVHAAAERRRLIDPLRALVGAHFRGRVAELATLHRHIRRTNPTPVLRLHGPGGVGKSSLVGRLLLDLEEQAAVDPQPFAYLDFDRARHDPRNPIGLVEQIARQLRLLFASAAEVARFAALESYGGGTDAALVAEQLQLPPGRDLDVLVGALAEQLRDAHASRRDPDASPLVLVLDTFEEVQAGGPGPVRDVLALVDTLLAALPGTRVIIAGRSVLVDAGGGTPLVLGDLDPPAADAVLEHYGVSGPAVRSMIVDRFGRNPLTLRLAAEALVQLGSSDEAFAGVLCGADLVAEVAREQVQGMLYGRILGHLREPEVVRVAHPGLAVRLITVEVLREVLAQPCQLDPDRAEKIFDLLRREVRMFELEDAVTLRHREDVRRLMLRLASDEPQLAAKVADIHRRAAEFYGGRPGDAARAEELYHRLMSGADPRELDRLWDPALAVGALPALDEPLPPRARAWLRRRLDQAPETGHSEWEQDDWEASAAGRAESWLRSADPRAATAVLAERDERLPGSRLLALDMAAATALGDLDRAEAVLQRGMAAALDDGDLSTQLELAEQALTLRAQQRDHDGIGRAARTVLAVTDLTGQPVRAVEALVRAVRAQSAIPPGAPELSAELARRFTALIPGTLRADPLLVRRVLHAIGRTVPAVLLHAAAHTGDLTVETGVFLPDALALTRLLDATVPSAQPALDALAAVVGAARHAAERGSTELAARAVRLGRCGDAIRLGIDYARDPATAAALVVDEMVRPGEGDDGIPLPGRRHAR